MEPVPTEHFTRALAVTHMLDGMAVGQEERIAAEQYLMLLRGSPEGLNLAFHILSNEEFTDIRCFWAFNTVMHHLPAMALSMDAAQSSQLHATLSMWLVRQLSIAAPIPDFILNKHAQMMVVGIQEFYPARWANAFDDVFQLLHRREQLSHARDQLTLYFLRVFEYIDERVVSVRGKSDRGREQRIRDMEVKDAMREHVITQAVAAWHHVLCEYRGKAIEIARTCLEVIQTYVEWIDIALIVTPDWINLLYLFTTVPYLRQGACQCLTHISEKKQLAPVKVDTLTAMGIADALPKIVQLVPNPSTDEEVGFLLEVVSLTVSAATQLLECADGGGVQEASPMLHRVVPEVLRLLSIRNPQALDLLLPFVHQYIKTSHLQEQELGGILHLVYRHTVLSVQDLQSPTDETIDQRKILHNLCRLMYRRTPTLVMDHCSRVVADVTGVPSPQALPPAEAEAALRYLYELGETQRMDVLRDTTHPMAQMIFYILHCSALTMHPDSVVHLAYFELMERYHTFFVHHRDQVSQLLIHLLVLPSGIQNPNDRVRSRVCYLFGHLLQQLKVQFAQHSDEIVRAMKDILQNSLYLTPSDKLDLYEGMGTVLSISDPSMCVSVAEGVVQHMQSIGVPGGGTMLLGNENPEQLAITVADDIAFLSRLAKGIGGTEATKIPDSPPLAARDHPSAFHTASLQEVATQQPPLQVFWQVTRDVLIAVERWISFPVVRDRACLFMHQMVNILPFSSISEFLESFVVRMLSSISAAVELPKILRVFYQFVNKTRSSSIDCVRRILPIIVTRVIEIGGTVEAVRTVHGVVSEYTKEQLDVFRSYFSAIHAIAHCSCFTALTTSSNDVLGQVLNHMVAALKVSAEFDLPKQSLQIIARLAFQLCGESGYELFTSFLLHTVLPNAFHAFTDPSEFDLNDAKNFFLISELAQILKTVLSKLGDAGAMELVAVMTTHSVLQLDGHVAHAFVARLRDEPRATSQFKIAFKQLLESVKQRRLQEEMGGGNVPQIA